MSALLRVEELSKSFPTPQGRLCVLDQVSFSVEAGEFVAIIGESGAGKSTLLQTIAALEPMDAGSVWIDGEAVHALAPEAQAWLRSRKLGFVYQFHHLIPELTALENVMLPLWVQGAPPDEARTRGMALLQRLGVAERAAHRPGQLSGGEQQRVAIARALAGNPKLVLADEPTGNLDERTGMQVFALFREVCREHGAAVVMVTHSLRLARRCDRVLVLSEGQVHPAKDEDFLTTQ
ncbi:MAG: ABC transporter ATP-binding protein [Zetaproteobacteria bacterium]|nr:MAG: ABC transporter ATP-binding protein [Zetaproteobacteria bacterium]